MIGKRIQVFGKVQGVFYRATTKTKAEDLGLTGWVKNEPDGSVLIEVEGSESDLTEFEIWCKRGPEFSNVEKVSSKKIELSGFTQFQIRH